MDDNVAIERQLRDVAGDLPRLLAELFRTFPLGIVVARLDEERPRMWSNPACVRILGMGHELLRSRSFEHAARHLNPEDRAPALERAAQLGQGHSPVEPAEYRLMRPDGSEIWILTTPYLLEADPSPLVLWVVQDINERKRVEQDLRDERERLERTARERERQNRLLRELIEQVSLERERQRQRVEANARLLLLPLLDRIRAQAPRALVPELDALRTGIEKLGWELGITLARTEPALTPRELEICALIRSGLRTRDIARSLGLSVRSVEAHRHNIRTKLGLRGKGANLASHLAFLDRKTT